MKQAVANLPELVGAPPGKKMMNDNI